MPLSLNLHPRAIGTWLTPEDGADAPPIDPSDGRYVWLDSSLELQHGLDVVELTIEVVNAALVATSPASSTSFVPKEP